jgi:hypothetical protein
LALGGLDNLIEQAALLSALVDVGAQGRIRIYCTPDCAELLEGFDLQTIELNRYFKDETYRASIAQSFMDYAPELAINLDRRRGIEADDLLASNYPSGAVAFDLPERGQDPALMKALNGGYTCLIPQIEPSESMFEALGLEAVSPRLWPASSAQEEVQTLLEKLAWDPEQIRLVLVDHPSLLEDPAFNAALTAAAEKGGYLIGIGGKGVSYQRIEALLMPWKDRSANLTGVLSLATTVALLQHCQGYVGGTPRFQALAKVCGHTPRASK